MTAGLWSLSIISNSQTELEYANRCHKLDTYTHTPPPVLDEWSHLIIEKPGILISPSSIPSCKKVSHRHNNRVDLSQKSDNSFFLLVRVMRQATFINIKLYIEGTRVILLSFTESCKWGLVEVESLLMGPCTIY